MWSTGKRMGSSHGRARDKVAGKQEPPTLTRTDAEFSTAPSGPSSTPSTPDTPSPPSSADSPPVVTVKPSRQVASSAQSPSSHIATPQSSATAQPCKTMRPHAPAAVPSDSQNVRGASAKRVDGVCQEREADEARGEREEGGEEPESSISKYLFSQEEYDQLLTEKQDKFLTFMGGLVAGGARGQALEEEESKASIEVHQSDISHYRMRAEFRVWHEGEQISFAMFDKSRGRGKRTRLVKLTHFPTASRLIDAAMPLLLEYLAGSLVLKTSVFQATFLSTLSGQLLLTLVYHRSLRSDPAWENEARALGAFLTDALSKDPAVTAELRRRQAELTTSSPVATSSAESSKEEVAGDGVENGVKVAIVGRSKGEQIFLSDDHVTEQFAVRISTLRKTTSAETSAEKSAEMSAETSGDEYTTGAEKKVLKYRQVENSFSQPNGRVNEKMLNWVHRHTRPSVEGPMRAGAKGALLELYCGNGNFCIALADNFERILATEMSKSSVKTAKENVALNDIRNIDVLRMSSEQFTEAMNGSRQFERLRVAGVDLSGYEWADMTVLVDPPRAGVDEATLRQILARFRQVIYISCNPTTLKRDLEILTETHDITHTALFDQFPYTDHIESGTILRRKSSEQN